MKRYWIIALFCSFALLFTAPTVASTPIFHIKLAKNSSDNKSNKEDNSTKDKDDNGDKDDDKGDKDDDKGDKDDDKGDKDDDQGDKDDDKGDKDDDKGDKDDDQGDDDDDNYGGVTPVAVSNTTFAEPTDGSFFAVSDKLEGMLWLNQHTGNNVLEGSAPTYNPETKTYIQLFALPSGVYLLDYTNLSKAQKSKGYKALKSLLGTRVEIFAPAKANGPVRLTISDPNQAQ